MSFSGTFNRMSTSTLNPLVNAPETATTAIPYLRVSMDRSGRERSTTEQDAELGPAAEAHGWVYGPKYTDQGSASRYATKRRDDYTRLIADLTADTFGAHVLMLWEFSRGSRDVGEWATLLDLCAKRGVRIYVHTHGRTYDPRNGRDRRSMIDDANDSEYESYKTSVRVKRDASTVAAAGGIWGAAPAGYRHVYDNRRGKLIGRVIDDERAPMIRDLFALIEAGHSGLDVARRLTADGWRNGRGNPYSWPQLRQMALNASYAGKRVHDPDNKRGHPPYSPTATFTDAVWPAIVEYRQWLAVQGILTAPGRMTRRPGRGIHLLSMHARCGMCGGPMAAREPQGRQAVYRCNDRACTQVIKSDLDEWATGAIFGYMARYHASTTPDETEDNAALADVRDRLARKSAEYEDFAAQVIAGAVSAAFAAKVEQGMAAAIADLEAQERKLMLPTQLSSLIEPGPDVADRWDELPMSVRRKIVGYVFSPDELGTLRVVKSDKRAGGRGSTPIADRVRVVPGE